MKDYNFGKRKKAVWEKGSFKWRLLLHYTYFSIGYGTLSIVKYFWLIVAGGSLVGGTGAKLGIILGFIYCIICYFFGMYWYENGLAEIQQEIGNRVNPFVRQLRKKVVKEKDL